MLMDIATRRGLTWRDAPAADGIGRILSALLLIAGGILVLAPLLSLVLAIVR
jgi:hypothetical protein